MSTGSEDPREVQCPASIYLETGGLVRWSEWCSRESGHDGDHQYEAIEPDGEFTDDHRQPVPVVVRWPGGED